MQTSIHTYTMMPTWTFVPLCSASLRCCSTALIWSKNTRPFLSFSEHSTNSYLLRHLKVLAIHLMTFLVFVYIRGYLQAMFRSYRYGQTKDVFIYRLLSSGSMEEKIYKKAVSDRTRIISCLEFARLYAPETMNGDWTEEGGAAEVANLATLS